MPLRLITTRQYADVAVSVYVKIGALASRPQGCTAATATIADYLGLSKASVERGMTQLTRPGPDGVVELSSVRRSLPGGCGTSAVRRTRPVTATEGFVWIPVAAAEDLTPRQLRVYALIAYAQAQGIPLTESEIAGAVHHHSGRKAGQPLTTAAAGEIVDALEAARWITVDRRAGTRGRHHFTAHDILPDVRPASGGQHDQDQTTPGAGEGSGSAADAGSLAYKEEPKTDRPDDERALFSPAVGEVQVGEAVENAVEQPPEPRAPGRLALRADENPPSSHRHRTYSGPPLTISARVHAVLEPVRWLYQRANVYMQRRIAREVGRQLRTGIADDRLRQRLIDRYARTMTDDVLDPGRWLLGVALPSWGCGIFDCEAGVLWSSGRRCSVCEEIVQDRRRDGAPDQSRRAEPLVEPPRSPVAPPVPRSDCRRCGCRILHVKRALDDGLCPLCRTEDAGVLALIQTAPDHVETCAGWDGAGCSRPALGAAGLCVRCRTRRLQCVAS
ncbi:hypothetical protein [Streptomyces sp. NPDC059743]|uniref:hypothetical protein n=1 Tax=Streptomyces sp. NPDC059743 TaxID=3346928 RepID=UPI00364E77C2